MASRTDRRDRPASIPAQDSRRRQEIIVDGARQLLRGRQEITALGPKGLFRDSAWDMLLELFIAEAEGHVLYTKHIMLASGETPAAAIRRIERLQDANFIERLTDALDQRRVIIRLTRHGHAALTAMLLQIFAKDPQNQAAAGPVKSRYRPHDR